MTFTLVMEGAEAADKPSILWEGRANGAMDPGSARLTPLVRGDEMGVRRYEDTKKGTKNRVGCALCARKNPFVFLRIFVPSWFPFLVSLYY
ncbi:MAG: hypothetical protein OEM59_21170 [Rhodospirillales bacterium]|nr:hypothetical protein [Rhodospirillales bacterium]